MLYVFFFAWMLALVITICLMFIFPDKPEKPYDPPRTCKKCGMIIERRKNPRKNSLVKVCEKEGCMNEKISDGK